MTLLGPGVMVVEKANSNMARKVSTGAPMYEWARIIEHQKESAYRDFSNILLSRPFWLSASE